MKKILLIMSIVILLLTLVLGGMMCMAHEKVYGYCENLCVEEVIPKRNIAVITGTITLDNGNGSANVNFPDGFTSENCVVISAGFQYANNSWWAFQYSQGLYTGVRMMPVRITFYVNVEEGGAGPTGDRPFKIVLMKVA